MNKILIILFLLLVSIQQFNVKLSKLINSIDNIEFASNVDSLDDNNNDNFSDFDNLDFVYFKNNIDLQSIHTSFTTESVILNYKQFNLLDPSILKITAPPQSIIA